MRTGCGTGMGHTASVQTTEPRAACTTSSLPPIGRPRGRSASAGLPPLSAWTPSADRGRGGSSCCARACGSWQQAPSRSFRSLISLWPPTGTLRRSIRASLAGREATPRRTCRRRSRPRARDIPQDRHTQRSPRWPSGRRPATPRSCLAAKPRLLARGAHVPSGGISAFPDAK
jgi:hypothetical protein